MDDIGPERDFYLQNSLTRSSQATYASGFQSYASFCSRNGFAVFPLVESILELYVSSMARRLAFSTIKVYISAIQYNSIINVFSESIADMRRLYYVLRGIRLFLANRRSLPRRRPITIHQLLQLHIWTRLRYSSYDADMLRAASSLAFFGLLRSSEYVSPHRHTASARALQVSDISFSHNLMLVHIKQSKTDPFRSSCTLRLAPTYTSVCPVRAMSRYLGHRNNLQGPIFTFADGSYLTRTVLSSLLEACFPGCSLNTHSFRIGGASSLASHGFSDATIQTLGRWRSRAYLNYIQLSNDFVGRTARIMARTPANTRIWDSSWLQAHQ